MKILFVIDKLGMTENIGIAYLSAMAKQDNHKTYFYSLDMLLFINYVKEIKPDVIAYSCNSLNFNNMISENKRLKKHFSFISIMGGPHPTFYPESFRKSGMDVYCIGEGEFAFRDFLQCVEDNRSFDNIPNLITKKACNDVRVLIENLDILPMPDHDLILGNTILGKTSKKTFFTSRGCSFNCSYCCNNIYRKLYKGKGKHVRRFSVDRIITEIEYVNSKYSMDFVKFDDDCFIIKNDKWLIEFCEKYKKRINKPFNCVLRFDLITDDILHLLKGANCHSVHLSIDSTNPIIREKILNRNMNFTNEEIIKRLRKIRSYGIETFVNFILGLPSSTIQDDINSIKMCSDSNISYPGYTMAVPFNGTKLYDYCFKHGYIDENYKCGDLLEWSTLNNFSFEQKIVQRNVFLLGALLSKMPHEYSKYFYPLLYSFNEKLYKSIRKDFHDFNMENVIYKIKRN